MSLTTDRANHRRAYERRKAAGQCVGCGVPHTGSVRCPACRAKKSVWDCRSIAKMRRAWRRLGICIVCGARRSMTGKTRCGYCDEAVQERNERKAS